MRTPRRRRGDWPSAVFEMVSGFSGFGFPKAHGAAFGLLAYQSTWLRVHYAPGVPLRAARRAADGLLPARRARPRGAAARDRGARARRQRQRGRVHGRRRTGAVRIGLGYVLGVRADEVAALVAAREAGGPFRSLGGPRLARRRRAGRRWSAWPGRAPATRCRRGAEQARRGGAVAARRRRAGRRRARRACSSRWRSSCPRRPELQPLAAWDAMVADYATTGLTLGRAPDRAAARRGCRRGAVSCRRPRARCRTGAACASAAWSSPASGRGPPRASCSCCSRTRRDGQPDRLAAGLRARPPDRAHRAARARRGPPGELPARRAGRSTSSCARIGALEAPIARRRGQGLLAAGRDRARAPVERGGARGAERRADGDGAPTTSAAGCARGAGHELRAASAPPVHRSRRSRRRRSARPPYAADAGAPRERRYAAPHGSASRPLLGLRRARPRRRPRRDARRPARRARHARARPRRSAAHRGRRSPSSSWSSASRSRPSCCGRRPRRVPRGRRDELSEAEKRGRRLFAERCANCHTLKAANAVGASGPNLDDLRPRRASCSTRSRRAARAATGQMPAELLEGEEAEDVAAYVAKAVGPDGQPPGAAAAARKRAGGRGRHRA